MRTGTIPKVHLLGSHSPKRVCFVQSESLGADGAAEPCLRGKAQPACVRLSIPLCSYPNVSSLLSV